jgi:hypothetical protein
LVVLDSRCGRVLTPGRRRILDEPEWAWFDRLATGDCDHLVVGTSLPYLLPTGLHYVEAWNEAVCDGAWGRRAARAGEKIRQAIDLEHWAAFRASFQAMARLVAEVATGRRGSPPASVLFLSGDVHYSYLARVDTPSRVATRLYQIVCSPTCSPLSRSVRLVNVIASVGVAGLVGRTLARAARLPRLPFRWRIERGPWFPNAVAVLDLDGRSATVRWYTAHAGTDPPELTTVAEVALT